MFYTSSSFKPYPHSRLMSLILLKLIHHFFLCYTYFEIPTYSRKFDIPFKSIEQNFFFLKMLRLIERQITEILTLKVAFGRFLAV